MRTTKELLELLLVNIDALKFGLCALALDLCRHEIINKYEYNSLLIYIDNNRCGNYYQKDCDYFWKPGSKKPRKVWLEQQIAYLDGFYKIEKIVKISFI
jgi:hypothetical protein